MRKRGHARLLFFGREEGAGRGGVGRGRAGQGRGGGGRVGGRWEEKDLCLEGFSVSQSGYIYIASLMFRFVLSKTAVSEYFIYYHLY